MSYEDSPDPRDFEQRESADNKLAIKFYIKPVKNEAESAKEGRPMFDDRHYIEIRVPGDQCNVIHRPVTEDDKNRFRRQYQQFKEGQEQSASGTPLEEVPWITRSQVEELKYVKVNTLEQLADLNDSTCQRFAGLFKLKQRAQEHLKLAKEAAPAQALEKFKEEMEVRLSSMQQTIDEQSSIIQTQRKQLEKAQTEAAK